MTIPGTGTDGDYASPVRRRRAARSDRRSIGAPERASTDARGATHEPVTYIAVRTGCRPTRRGPPRTCFTTLDPSNPGWASNRSTARRRAEFNYRPARCCRPNISQLVRAKLRVRSDDRLPAGTSTLARITTFPAAPSGVVRARAVLRPRTVESGSESEPEPHPGPAIRAVETRTRSGHSGSPSPAAIGSRPPLWPRPSRRPPIGPRGRGSCCGPRPAVRRQWKTERPVARLGHASSTAPSPSTYSGPVAGFEKAVRSPREATHTGRCSGRARRTRRRIG